MSSKQKGDGTGKLELTVKMDYSETYRENERLRVDLGEHIDNLNRHAYRARTEKDDKLETAKATADKFLKLKEAAKNIRQQHEGSFHSATGCQSPPRMSSASSGRSSSRGAGGWTGRGSRASVDTNNNRKSSAGGRKLSSMSSATLPSQDGSGSGSGSGSGEGEGEGEGSDSVDIRPATATGGSSFQQLAEAVSNSGMAIRAMTLTERRWAEEKARFTAKNLFNVRRSNNATVGHFMIDRSAKADNSGDAGRKGLSSAMSTDRNISTSSSAYGRQLPGRRNKRNRSAPLFVRLTQSDSDDRKARSRRELRKLSELGSESFADVDSLLKRPMSCTVRESAGGRGSSGVGSGGGGSGGGGSGGGAGNVNNVSNMQQDILQRLRGGRSQLDERVSVFLKDMDNFNKRGRKSGLDQILSAR